MSGVDPSADDNKPGGKNKARPPRAKAEFGTDAIAERLRSVSSWVQEKTPGLKEKTRKFSLFAYRRGSRLLATNEMTAAGIDLLSAGVAVGCSVLLYLLGNFYLASSVDRSYEQFRPAQFAGVTTQEEAAKAITAAGWLDEAEADRFPLGASNATFGEPFHVWIEDIFLHSGVDADKRRFAERMRSLATGDRSGWIMISPKSTTGNGIFEELLKLDGPNGHIDLTIGKNTTRKRLFVAMCDELLSSSQPPIRWMFRVNGMIQFLTVLLSIFVLFAILRRYLFVVRLADRWLNLKADQRAPANSTGEHTADAELLAIAGRMSPNTLEREPDVVREELDRIRSEANRSVYDSYWFVAGILPSLGFIGTVIGMSSALLKADRLFAATDRQLAIGEMTKELGLAFDTTLIALLMGLLVTVLLATVRAREFTFYREFARRISSLNGASQKPLGVTPS